MSTCHPFRFLPATLTGFARSRWAMLVDRRAAESGSAVVEFIFGSVILLIPLVYLAIALGSIQAGSYAASATAIDSARAASRYPDTAAGRAQAIADMHLSDFGLDAARHRIEFECPRGCSVPGSAVTAHVQVDVPIPGVYEIFGAGGAGTITVTADHTDVIAPYYRETP